MRSLSPSRATGADAIVVFVLCTVAAVLYATLARQLAATVYADYINLAFDFDPAYFVRSLAGPPPTEGMGINYKHPGWMLFRWTAAPFLWVGLDAKTASALGMAVTGTVSVALVYGYLRSVGLLWPEAAAATVFFGASSTSLFVAIIPESYGWANATLVGLWWLYLRTLNGRRAEESGGPKRLFAVPVAVLVAGATVSNVVQPLIADAVAAWRDGQARTALRRVALFGLLIAALLLLVLLVYQPVDLWNMLAHPVRSAKEVYWQQTKGARVGLGELLKTYFVYSFFAPDFSLVPLSPVFGMLDFRSFSYPPLMWVVTVLWLVFGLCNVALAVRVGDARRLLPALGLALAFNLLFHLGYQYRGSLYLYAAHLHFLVFALGLSAGPWVGRQGGALRWGYAAMLAVFALAALVTNVDRARDLIQHMKTVPDLRSVVDFRP